MTDAAPLPVPLDGPGPEERPAFAQRLHSLAVGARQEADRHYWIVANALHLIREHELWRELQYDSWMEYLASPEIGISPSESLRYLRIRARLAPHIAAGTLTEEEVSTIPIRRSDRLSALLVNAEPETVRAVVAEARTLKPADFEKRMRERAGKDMTAAEEYLFDVRQRLRAQVVAIHLPPDEALIALQETIQIANEAIGKLRGA